MRIEDKIKDIEELVFYSFISAVLVTGFCVVACKITIEKLNPFK